MNEQELREQIAKEIWLIKPANDEGYLKHPNEVIEEARAIARGQK